MSQYRNKTGKAYTIESDENDEQSSEYYTPKEQLIKHRVIEDDEPPVIKAPSNKFHNQNVLFTSGVVEAYENLMKEFCDYGFPKGNVFEFAIVSILKFEKRLRAERANKFQAERALDIIKKAKMDYARKSDKSPTSSARNLKKDYLDKDNVKRRLRTESLDLDSTSSNSYNKAKYAKDDQYILAQKKSKGEKSKYKSHLMAEDSRTIDNSYHKDPRFEQLKNPQGKLFKFPKYEETGQVFEAKSLSERNLDNKNSKLVDKNRKDEFSKLGGLQNRNNSLPFNNQKSSAGEFNELTTNEQKYRMELLKKYPEKYVDQIMQLERGPKHKKTKSHDVGVYRSNTEISPDRTEASRNIDDFSSFHHGKWK